MTNKPLVSILIANYNKQKFIDRCVNSCLNQTYKNIEVIFVDDSSTDNSYKVAKKFKKIKLYKKNNKNRQRKFNTFFQIDTYLYAFKKSKGKYISFLDADDFFEKKKIECIVNFFESDNNYPILFDKPIIYYSKKSFSKKENFNNSLRKNKWPKFPPQSCISIKRNFFKILLNEVKKKKFNLLTLDFRLAILSHIVHNKFFILDKYLTFYFQNNAGESRNKFRMFNSNWWLRRAQAFKYLRYLSNKYKKDYTSGLDYIITIFISFNIKLFQKILG